MTMKNRKNVLILSLISFLILGCATSSRNKTPNRYPEESLGWQLGAQAYTFNRLTFTEALDKIESCGLRDGEAYPQQRIGSGINETMDSKMPENSKKYIRELCTKKNRA